jgi:signal transduction histidine kinase
MIFILIAAAAVINIILGVLALIKGRNRLNFSFAILSFLFAAWNICVVFWDGYNLQVFSRINFLFVTFVPPAALFFVRSLFEEESRFLDGMLKLYTALGLAGLVFTLSTFFSGHLLDIYMLYQVRFAIFMYECLTLLAAFGVLIYRYMRIKFKQERTKIRYVILAFGLLFLGGMLDFMGGLKMHNLMYMGNISNVAYAALIFYAIFRLRLLDAGVLFKNFAVYTLVALVLGTAYTALALLLKDKPIAMAAAMLTLSLPSVYFLKYLHGYVDFLVQKISGVAAIEGARASFAAIKSMQAPEGEKIRHILLLLGDFYEMDAAIYSADGAYFVLTWETDRSGFVKLMDTAAGPGKMIIRYEAKDPAEKEMLDKFGASIIAPLKYASQIEGILAGRKQTADISFNQDEIELLGDICEAAAFYMKAYALGRRVMEEENMKRIAMMARQMAHEIKNPLAALWGAAQLLEGKSAQDIENTGIIREEIQRLTGMLDSWKDFAGELKVERAEFNIVKLVYDVIKLVNLQGMRAAMDFGVHPDFITVNADADKIKQVLLNVMLNAVQAAQDSANPAVKVSAALKNGFAEIKVRDNGGGVGPVAMEKIRQPLFTTKPKGSGLGLAVSDRIMKAHGGSLIIQSDGSSFTEITIALPTRTARPDTI